MKLIGKGSFTKAYLREDGMVELHSCCPAKECMAMGLFPESRYFPKVKKIGENIYEMKLYDQPSSFKNALTPDQWAIYKELDDLQYKAWRKLSSSDNAKRYYILREVFQEISDEEVRGALLEALDAFANYTFNIGFEIAKRNLAVEDDQLILLDCFFSRDTLTELRNK